MLMLGGSPGSKEQYPVTAMRIRGSSVRSSRPRAGRLPLAIMQMWLTTLSEMSSTWPALMASSASATASFEGIHPGYSVGSGVGARVGVGVGTVAVHAAHNNVATVMIPNI